MHAYSICSISLTNYYRRKCRNILKRSSLCSRRRGKGWGNWEKEREGGGERAPYPSSLSFFSPISPNHLMRLIGRLEKFTPLEFRSVNRQFPKWAISQSLYFGLDIYFYKTTQRKERQPCITKTRLLMTDESKFIKQSKT